MNALWLTKMSTYRNSSLCVESAKKIIYVKISRQSALLKKHHRLLIVNALQKKTSVSGIFLEEARTAKHFWHEYGFLLPQREMFKTRKPGNQDTVNKLLDIGYHHLCNIVGKILKQHDISTSLGLLHVARTSTSVPLVYDLVEMFRSDIVDTEVLRFLQLKKKGIHSIEKEISHFLHEINRRLEKKFYLKEFKMCHSYYYYMEVQIIKFIKAVNHKKIFDPIHLPVRHENRCS